MYLYQASAPFSNTPAPNSLISIFLPLSLQLKTESMKPVLHSSALLLFLLFLIFSPSSRSSARLLTRKQGGERVRSKEMINGASFLEVEVNDSFEKLMGVEACENGDEECLKRRIISEAHLDYIYTQNHKP